MNTWSIWLGGGERSAISKRCEQTWPEDHKIYTAAMLSSVVPWLHDIKYYRDAIAAEHWAGASDVARLALLYEVGGCYLDVDVEIVNRPYIDALDDGWFHIGQEDDGGNLCGAVMIALAGHQFAKDMLDTYGRTRFGDTFNGKCNGTTLLTRQPKLGVHIHDAKEFYPWHWSENLTDNQKGERIELLKPIFAHHWEKSWSQINQKE